MEKERVFTPCQSIAIFIVSNKVTMDSVIITIIQNPTIIHFHNQSGEFISSWEPIAMENFKNLKNL